MRAHLFVMGPKVPFDNECVSCGMAIENRCHIVKDGLVVNRKVSPSQLEKGFDAFEESLDGFAGALSSLRSDWEGSVGVRDEDIARRRASVLAMVDKARRQVVALSVWLEENSDRGV